jgi:hypothetical protein
MRSCFRVLELRLLCPHVADSPPGACGRSARSRLIGCSSCPSCVLVSLCFDPSSRGFSVARCLVDGPRGRPGQSLGRGRSARRRRTIRFSGCATRGSGAPFRRFAPYLRTVRLSPADGPQSPCGQSSPGIADCLSPLLLQLHFRVSLCWALFLGWLVCCDYATLAKLCGNPRL